MLASACSAPMLGDFPINEVEVGGESLTVAVATRPEELHQGLRAVNELPAGVDGMLFVFESPRPGTFTMEDTLIPLDIWWFDESGVMYDSTTMTPCVTSPCPVYPSPNVIGWALETPAGERVFEVGDELTMPGS